MVTRARCYPTVAAPRLADARLTLEPLRGLPYADPESLKPGTTLAAASAQVATIAQAYSLSHPTNADVKASAGVALAQLTLGVVKQWAGDRIPRVEEVALDPAVLLFSLGVSLLVGLLLGLLPAWQLAKPDLVDALKDSSRGTSGGRGQSRTRTALMVGEVAVSFALLAVAGWSRASCACRASTRGFVRRASWSRESSRRPDAIRIAAKRWCSSTRDSWSGPARFPG